jgi:hypothetical protein
MSKIRLTMIFTKEYDVDYDNYTINVDGVDKKLTKEEAIAFDKECVADDPFGFIDSDDVKLEVKIEDI